MKTVKRFRRLRRVERLRRLVRETSLHPSKLIAPIFVVEGRSVRRAIPAMPGIFQFSTDQAVQEAKQLVKLGVGSVILFGIPRRKDVEGSEAFADHGVVQQAVRALKKHIPDLTVITDVCLCEFTSHGHCAIFPEDGRQVKRAMKEGTVAIDHGRTLDTLAKIAVSHARAGADMVAPSDMMDGRVKAIREALDGEGASEVPILSYAAKYSSAFYGPFRDAVQSAPSFGDRRSYQMDPANRREALREILADIEEGADIVMVKPALAYMDIIAEARRLTQHPIAAYNVSGEYAMVKAAAQKGWLNEEAAVKEILTGLHRAGADLIVTYHAKEFCQSFQK